jgi:hypothetical protein
MIAGQGFGRLGVDGLDTPAGDGALDGDAVCKVLQWKFS